jgi:serine phosphatase RsbU (regulator of sigma subunit)/ligand-binding sensor domain-containing protein
MKNILQFKLRKISLTWIIICLTGIAAQSQSIQNNFTHFTEMDGLPSNETHMIIQDHLGYIWIGTSNGLSRYDGYEFLNYSPVPNDTNFLQVSVIHSLYEDSRGDIWIGAVGGLTRFDREKEKFKLYSYNQYEREPGKTFTVGSMCETENGDILFGVRDIYEFDVANGLFLLDRESGNITQIEAANDDSIQVIIKIEKVGKDKFIITGYKGFAVYDHSNKFVNWYPFNEHNPVFPLLKDGNSYWLGVVERGVVKYNLEDSTYITIPIFENFPKNKGYSVVSKIILDKNGKLLVSSNRGLFSIDRASNTYERAVIDPLNPAALHSEELNYILQDNSGNIWITTNNSGISRYNISKSNFRSYKYNPNVPKSIPPGWIHMIYEMTGDKIWIQNNNNVLAEFDRRYDTFNKINFPFNRRITSIFNYDRGSLWLAGVGLYKLNLKKWSFEEVDIPLKESQFFILTSLVDSRNTIWMGTTDGLVTFDKENSLTATVDFESLGIGDQKSNIVYRLVEDNNNNIWIGTDNGLFKYDLNDRQYSRVGNSPDPSKSLLSQDVNSLYADKYGKIWIGTWLGGLNRYDPASGEIDSFGKDNGLKSHSIHGILGDEQNGAIWVSTFNGISRFDIEKKTFQNFTIEDGIQGNQFADGSYLKTSDGYFIFGGQNGITMFKPEDIKSDLIPPRVVITDIKIFDESVKNMEDSPLTSSIFKTDMIELNYDQNDISIEYFAPHYVNPKRNKYAYRLVNYEADWRQVGNKRSAIYPNLPPGDYIFEVKAANNNNVWSEEEESIEITIHPPPWNTWWAYSLYGFFVIGILYSARKMELTRQKKNTEIKESQLRAEAAEAQAKLIKAESERKTRELEEARQLQLSMLPKELPQLPNLDIAVYMKTATEVGGDYYDFHVSLDGTLTVVLGDATGHGMKAGTMVTAVKGLFNSYAPNPDILFSFHEMTRCIKQMHLEKLSMCMTMLKIAGNELNMSAAGMPPVFIHRKGDQVTEEIMIKGMPLGTMEKFPYDVRETKLNTGDTVLLMSDGFPELQNSGGEQFGYKRARNLFEEAAGNSPEEIISTLKDEGSRWVDDKDPDDDVTFVVIKVK